MASKSRMANDQSGLSRRNVLMMGAASMFGAISPLAAAAEPDAATAEKMAKETTREGLHGLSLFVDDLALPADFKHFAYVNPDAPKGGFLRTQPPFGAYNQNLNTFNTLNGYVQKGAAPPRLELTFDSLMVRALDEPDSLYGLVAERVDIIEPYRRYRFHLRKEARFHDGSPLTARDVTFSLLTLKEKGHADLLLALRKLTSVDVEDDAVLITLAENASPSLILMIASLPIFSRAYWKDKDFTASTQQPVLGSGPYHVGARENGRFIAYERVTDYWAKDLPVNIGHHNFDTIRLEFYKDRTAAFEALKSGTVTVREEFTSKTWATGYDFPALKDGRVKRYELPADTLPQLQGLFFNLRRAKFRDPRTREAIGLAFDFEWTNEKLFYGAYSRAPSFFSNSPYQATGKPSAEELALLEPYRGQIPDQVFETAYVPPQSDGSGRDRTLLKRAATLLEEAGWQRKGYALFDAEGKKFELEFLLFSPSFQRIIGPYVKTLKRLGIDARIRMVDPSEFQQRVNTHDFDCVTRALRFTATPVSSPRTLFSSKAASLNGSANYSGIAHPAIDALIEKLERADNRKDATTLLRAIDRLLRSMHIWVPNWASAHHRMAVWDAYRWPESKPDYGFPYETTWWFDPERAKDIGLIK